MKAPFSSLSSKSPKSPARAILTFPPSYSLSKSYSTPCNGSFLLLALPPAFALAAPPTTTTVSVASGCNRDNCLREFIRLTASATSYCQSVTITPSPITSTVVAVTPFTETSTLGSAPSPVKARALAGIGSVSIPMQPPAVTAAPAKRAASVAFPSMCTGATTRPASACSCLGMPLTTAAPATIYQTTYPSTTTVAACNDAQFGLGIDYGFATISQNPENLQLSSGTTFPGVTDPRECCAKCFTTAGCVSYYTYFFGYCQLDTYTAPPGTPADAGSRPICPNGKVGGSLPTPGKANGLGPCLDLLSPV